MMDAKGVCVAIAVLAASSPAIGQIFKADAAMVARLAGLARSNLSYGRLADGARIPPESPEELSRPIVPAELDVQTVYRGALTGELQVCGADWATDSYLPYMTSLRASGRYSEKQLGYIGILHGVTQGLVHDTMKPHVRGCSKGTLKSLRKAAAKPVATP